MFQKFRRFQKFWILNYDVFYEDEEILKEINRRNPALITLDVHLSFPTLTAITGFFYLKNCYMGLGDPEECTIILPKGVNCLKFLRNIVYEIIKFMKLELYLNYFNLVLSNTIFLVLLFPNFFKYSVTQEFF